MNIPFQLEAAAVLATFVYWHASPAQSCSWGFTHLPPTCNSKQFGYRFAARQVEDIDVIWVEGAEE